MLLTKAEHIALVVLWIHSNGTGNNRLLLLLLLSSSDAALLVQVRVLAHRQHIRSEELQGRHPMSRMALYVVIIRGFMYDLMIVLVQHSFLFWGIEIILRHNFDLFNQ